MKMNAPFPPLMDYIDIIAPVPRPPTAEEKRLFESFREIVKKYDVVFMTPRAGKPIDETEVWVVHGDRKTNFTSFEVLKRRKSDTSAYIDYEASFKQSDFIVGAEPLDRRK